LQQQIDQIVGATGGVDQNLRLRNVGSNLPHYVDAVDFRKLIGRDNYVRVCLDGLLNGFLPMGGFRDDLPIRLSLQVNP